MPLLIGLFFLIGTITLVGNFYFPGVLSNSDAIARVVYAFALLVLVSGSISARFRGQYGQAAKYLAIWVLIGVSLVLLYSMRDAFFPLAQRLQAELFPSYAVRGLSGESILHAGLNGHFSTVALTNGERVRFMVDTGASRVVLSYEDAKRIGLDTESLHFAHPVNTANGTALVAPVQLDYIQIGEIHLPDVAASVAQPGKLSGSLLGMSFLNRLRSFEFRGDQLVLRK
jgi:aspartyl protease family protein